MHTLLMEVDDETGERFPICPSCAIDWPCVYAERDTLRAELAAMTQSQAAAAARPSEEG